MEPPHVHVTNTLLHYSIRMINNCTSIFLGKPFRQAATEWEKSENRKVSCPASELERIAEQRATVAGRYINLLEML